jgi:hypothetical protein
VVEEFDPYLEWLGIRETTRPLSHYQLLGIAEFEADPLAIAVAADAATARIKSCNPLDRGGRWQQLLDEVSLARLCLSDRARKLQYDEQLRTRRGTNVDASATKHRSISPSVEGKTQQSTNASSPVNLDLFPPNYRPAPQPAAAKLTEPTKTVPMLAPVETVSTPHEFAMPPVKHPIVPKAIPVGLAVETAIPVANRQVRPITNILKAEPANEIDTPIFADESIDQLASHKRTNGNQATRWSMVGMIATMGVTIVVALGGLVLWQQNMPSQVTENTNNATVQKASVVPGEPTAEMVNSPNRSDGGRKLTAREALAPQSIPDAAGRQKMPLVPSVGVVANEPPSKTQLPTVPTQPEQTAEQKAAFDLAVKRALQAMGARKLDVARQELDSAKRNAVAKQQEAELHQLEQLHGYVKGFWDAVRESLKSLQATDTLPLGNSQVAVVEVDPSSITIRTAGRNFSYTLTNMSPEVAVALANHWFDENVAANKIYLGTFHAVDAQGDAEEAKRLWKEATNEGADATELFSFLNDRQSISNDD